MEPPAPDPAPATASAAPSPPIQPGSARTGGGRYRWVICGLLFWVTTANYVDRAVFGNLAPDLQKTIHWTQQDYWNMQVAFNAAYAVSQIAFGWLLDTVGLRLGFAAACAFWGLASMGHALVRTTSGFFLVRILLGLGEGGNFPAAIKTTAEWFPKRERALATGIFNSGTNLGGVLVPWALPFVLAQCGGIVIGGHILGWRGAFLLTGGIDLLWIGAWLAIYRKPADHPRVSQAELDFINSEPPEPAVRIAWRRLFPHRQAWAYASAKFMTDCFWWFYLFGTPYFLADRFKLSLASRGLPVASIYVLASLGSVAGGWIAGRLMKAGWSVNRARKFTMLICCFLVMPVAYASLTENKWLAVGLVALAASAHQAWMANVYSLASDLFPRRIVASVAGFGGMAGSVGGIVLFLIVGHIRKAAIARGESGNYVPIFVAAAGAYIAALALVQALAPRLEPARLDEPEPGA